MSIIVSAEQGESGILVGIYDPKSGAAALATDSTATRSLTVSTYTIQAVAAHGLAFGGMGHVAVVQAGLRWIEDPNDFLCRQDGVQMSGRADVEDFLQQLATHLSKSIIRLGAAEIKTVGVWVCASPWGLAILNTSSGVLWFDEASCSYIGVPPNDLAYRAGGALFAVEYLGIPLDVASLAKVAASSCVGIPPVQVFTVTRSCGGIAQDTVSVQG